MRKHDGQNYEDYNRYLKSMVSFIEPTLTQVPPNLPPTSYQDISRLLQLKLQTLKNPKGAIRFLQLFRKSAADILDKWFESDNRRKIINKDKIAKEDYNILIKKNPPNDIFLL